MRESNRATMTAGARGLTAMSQLDNLDHPDKVERAAPLDIIPTHYLFSCVDMAFAESARHRFFFARPTPPASAA